MLSSLGPSEQFISATLLLPVHYGLDGADGPVRYLAGDLPCIATVDLDQLGLRSLYESVLHCDGSRAGAGKGCH